MPKQKPAQILNSIKKIQRDLERLHADITTFDFSDRVQDGGTILDCLNGFMKESNHDYILKLRVKGTEGEVVMGDLDYDVHEETGDWIWQINGTQFTTDNVEWIDPDWGIIMLKRTW